MKKVRKAAVVAMCLIFSMSFSACKNSENTDVTGDRLKVSVTFNAMEEFVNAVGKDKVEVSRIIPDGMEAHDFEPKAQDLAGLSKADIFVYNGLGMESWALEAADAADNQELLVVDASDGADVIVKDDEDNHIDDDDDGDGDGDGDGHSHGKYDPHLWLGLEGAKKEAENIKNALIEKDPDNKDFYEENYSEFAEQLDDIYNEYSKKFERAERKTFVTGHAAFGYLCRDFGLVQSSVKDIYAEGEPSAQQLGTLVEYCRENGVTTIFAEEMASPEVSRTLADEVGAKVETIYTMETDEDGKSYIERMKENLDKIYNSLI